MSAAMSALPPPADSKKRRPAFRPANQKKKAAKIASPSKVVLERKEPASVDVDPLAEYENVPTEITANENEAPGVLFEEPAAAPPVEPKRRGPKRTVTPAADPSAPNALSSFCSKYRSKGPPKPKDIPDPLPPPTAVEPEPAAPIHAGPVVQIINGEIVLQASSMVVSSARKTVAELEEEFDQVVEEEGHTAVVGASYNSFVSRRKPQHWTVQETKLFYNALRQVGTDFACMESYFENRTRKQLKRKYQIESTKNPKLIELALDPKAKVAIGTLCWCCLHMLCIVCAQC
jgi:Myb DNA-binding like